MDYRESLERLQPSLHLTNQKRTYRVTYYVPSLGKWHWHDNCCLWQCWYLCKLCAEMGRKVRILDVAMDTVFGTEVAILNLFSICLNGRNALRHKNHD